MKDEQPNLPRIKLGAIIRDLCEQAGCNKAQRKQHYDQFMKRWNPHPPPGFVGWWKPTERDPVTGADIGGHPEARRRWARKEPWGYSHRWYGTDTEAAWNCADYKAQYEAWVLAGCPEHPDPFVSLAATTERQQEFWRGLKATIAKIGKKMPEPDPGALSLEGVPEAEI